MAVTWDPRQYLAYGDLRLRPGLELLARVEARAPDRVADLGCGPGNLTACLARRWPGAALAGVDLSADMLARAQAETGAEFPAISWQQSDLSSWTPAVPPDVIYSNAALHWVGDHEALFPRLVGCLAAGGELAVQMPRNFDQPSHTSIAETAAEGPWKERLAPVIAALPSVPGPEAYYDILFNRVSALDLWETTYVQVLEGDDPVLAWTMGSVLRPVLGALEDGEKKAFLAAHGARLRAAYPVRADGKTLFPFKRLFIFAKK